MPSIAQLDTGGDETGHIEYAGFIGGNAVFATVDGVAHLLADRHREIRLHDGLLAATRSVDGNLLLTSGEDGRVSALDAEGNTAELFSAPGKWIDRIAAGPNGAVAFSWGRNGVVLAEGDQKPFESERTIEGLAFAPKGMRLALARYNGVELVWVNTNNPSQFLEWKGAHTGVTFSPDGKYVVSTMQENALHGWRITDNKHMRMTGYPAKVKSVSWSTKGKWLATSGAPAAITWPFSGKDGPMGKAPKELGAIGRALATSVACHPEEDVVAIGYENGMVLAVRIDDGKEALMKREGFGAISSLNWAEDGKRIAFGSETGEAGVIDITAG